MQMLGSAESYSLNYSGSHWTLFDVTQIEAIRAQTNWVTFHGTKWMNVVQEWATPLPE